MSARASGLRLAVPDLDAARALAEAWGPGLVASVETLSPEAAEAALRAGQVDLAFVPTLAVLRDPDAFSVVPGVALVGRAYRPARLHLPAGLEPFTPGRTARVGVDPRFTQEALLAQVVLRELYNARPQFVPYQGAPPVGLDGVMLPPEIAIPDEGLTLDLGREWFELTTRPMVWALLAATAGGVEPDEARRLRDAAREHGDDADPYAVEEPAAITLAAYAHAGLDAWVHHLFYHQALQDLPKIPFVEIPEEGDAQEES